jgi:hypothetical protein
MRPGSAWFAHGIQGRWSVLAERVRSGYVTGEKLTTAWRCTAQVIRWATAESGDYGLRPVVQLPVFSVSCPGYASGRLELAPQCGIHFWKIVASFWVPVSTFARRGV